MTFKNGQEHNCLRRLKNIKNLLVNDIEKPSRMYLFMTFKKRQACFIFFLNYNLFIFFFLYCLYNSCSLAQQSHKYARVQFQNFNIY